MEIYKGLIADMRFVSDPQKRDVLQIRRALPFKDASGAVCGFKLQEWEFVHTAHFDSCERLADDMAYSQAECAERWTDEIKK